MNYDEMLAGPEMDMAIGRLMGYDYREYTKLPGNFAVYGCPFACDAEDFTPSTNIAHAWEVVQKVTGDRRVDAFELSWDDLGWVVATMDWTYWVRADTAPLAICRAALKAMDRI